MCQLYANGVACDITRCDPTSSNPYAACLCGAPGPLRVQPPYMDIEYELTPAQINQINYQYSPQNGSNDIQYKVLA